MLVQANPVSGDKLIGCAPICLLVKCDTARNGMHTISRPPPPADGSVDLGSTVVQNAPCLLEYRHSSSTHAGVGDRYRFSWSGTDFFGHRDHAPVFLREVTQP